MGGATSQLSNIELPWRFQSTLPVGGATYLEEEKICTRAYFNPRSPWGERRRDGGCRHGRRDYFNPRSPWGERRGLGYGLALFLGISIHAPRGGSDMSETGRVLACTISIHAPRGGSDSDRFSADSRPCHFNPRSPWGERQLSAMASIAIFDFNPRSPWGERPGLSDTGRAESYFNPRSPWGERR